ncbi:zinc-binding alcohol dehydrogenase family protein [Bradyrhizobium sp.]|uniref:zinc-binding alcohol dehydrogenase family protein n=1 Tax=Bradyrhizobium sp. TaxID=376 RepID=UPI003BB10587
MAQMKAAIIREAGGPEVLRIESRPIPQPGKDRVLIRVMAFGLNRSGLFTRRGLSPGIEFPRVLGIEAAGLIAEAPGGQFREGQVVATAMGGMGRQFDGSYAEYVCVPAAHVQCLRTDLPWERLGALPEMLQTAWSSLFTALQLESGDTLLIRGGTTSVGLAAAAVAKSRHAKVVSTTRNPDRIELLRNAGADEVIIDDGRIAEKVKAMSGGGANKDLELVGTTTLSDSIQCVKRHGIVCMTGMVGDKWWLDQFSPMDVIPTAVCLTTYSGAADDFMQTPLQSLVEQVEAGSLRIQVGRVFHLDQIAEAHRCMEENSAGGKIVVLTS